jgi:DNA-binding PadR family transcriptional regulator
MFQGRDTEGVRPPLGASAFHILLVLAAGDQHGAGISAQVEVATHRTIRLTPGGLYRYLKQMLADGWIAESGGDADDGRMRIYRLTSVGRRVTQAEATRLESLVEQARSLRLLAARA